MGLCFYLVGGGCYSLCRSNRNHAHREGETVDRMMRDEGAGMGNASLPFSVTLDDFRLKRYPGSHSPMSYESDLVIKKENESFAGYGQDE